MKIQLLFIALLMFAFSFEASAVNSLVTVDGAATSLTKQDAQKTNIFQKAGKWWKATKLKVVTKIVKRLAAIDFEDPATVLKYAIIGILGGLIVSILSVFVGGFLWYLSYLLWTIGWLLLLYWIYLKYLK